MFENHTRSCSHYRKSRLFVYLTTSPSPSHPRTRVVETPSKVKIRVAANVCPIVPAIRFTSRQVTVWSRYRARRIQRGGVVISSLSETVEGRSTRSTISLSNVEKKILKKEGTNLFPRIWLLLCLLARRLTRGVHKVSSQLQKFITKANEKTDKWTLLRNKTYIFKFLPASFNTPLYGHH